MGSQFSAFFRQIGEYGDLEMSVMCVPVLKLPFDLKAMRSGRDV